MWTKYITSIVFTRIKSGGTKKLKDAFPNIYFTTSDKTPTNPKFPTVYVKKLQGQEKGMTTEAKDIQGVLVSFQVDVIDNKSDSNAEEVSDVVCDIMKNMGFGMVGDPYPNSQSTDEYRYTTRYQKIIADKDSF